jgi:outer membrane protein assembly factor BamE (lipoprotein component of BamABCDE complex)
MLIGAALLTSACQKVRGRQGYLIDEVLVSAIQPGVDTRESVQGTLGRPTFVGQFDQRDWYYVSRRTLQMAFNHPRAVEHTVLHIRFDEAGNVVAVDRSGFERVASIDPMNDKTPTLGRDRSFFEELFGSIGQVSTAAPAGSADNPQ